MANYVFDLQRGNSGDFDTLYPKTIWEQVLGKPSTFTPTSHNHNATDVNAGTLGVDRIPTLAQSKITNLTSDLASKVSKSGDTVSGDITLSPTATTQADQKAIKWKPIASRNPYFGYALDQTDGTFLWSITGTNYASGLAIGGGSGNLLYKGAVVVDATNISNYVTTYAKANSTTLGLLKVHSQANTQTAQTVPAEASKTATRQYSVQLDASGNSSVYVPWTTPTVPSFESTATNIKMNGTRSVGTSGNVPRADHVHPVDTSREPAIAVGTTAQFLRGDKTWQVPTAQITYTTTAPTANNNSGYLIMYVGAEPATKYNGIFYACTS